MAVRLCEFESHPPYFDPLAQSVEHNTFNVGVLGSNPKRITKPNMVWSERFARIHILVP